MSQTSTYLDRLGSELVAASRRLHHERVSRLVLEHSGADPGDGRGRLARATPEETGTRWWQIGRYPRGSRLRVGLTLMGAAGIAAIAAIVLSIVGLGAGTQRALADWTPTPTTPASGQTATAEAACIAKLPTSADIERARLGATRPGGATATHTAMPPLATVPAGEWQVAVTDTRGPLTLFMLEATGGKDQALCLSGPSGTYPTGVSFGGGDSATDGEVLPADQAKVSSFGHSRTALTSTTHTSTEPTTTPTSAEQLGEPYSTVSGRIGAEVTGVTLVLSDGTRVTASTANGYLLAWWPGWENATAVEVTTASATSTQQLYNPLTQSE